MTDKPDNPPAFPVFCVPGDIQSTSGMTIRDWFAGMAMQAYIAHKPSKTGLNAAMAYAQADEMLKARKP